MNSKLKDMRSTNSILNITIISNQLFQAFSIYTIHANQWSGVNKTNRSFVWPILFSMVKNVQYKSIHKFKFNSYSTIATTSSICYRFMFLVFLSFAFWTQIIFLLLHCLYKMLIDYFWVISPDDTRKKIVLIF